MVKSKKAPNQLRRLCLFGKVKLGFLRTMEAVIAIAITFVFLTLFIPHYNVADTQPRNENILESLAKDEVFRQCVMAENTTCINSSVSPRLQAYYYLINISKDPNTRAAGIPSQRVFSESTLISGNSTVYEPRVIRIYYWERT